MNPPWLSVTPCPIGGGSALMLRRVSPKESMTIRFFGALLCGAVCAASFAVSATPAYAGEPIAGVDTKLGKNGGGSRTYFVGTANGGVWRRNKSSIFDRWGNSPRGRVTGIAVDPSDPSGNRAAVRGKRQKLSEDSNPLPRDRALNRGQKSSNDGYARGNPMVHFRR